MFNHKQDICITPSESQKINKVETTGNASESEEVGGGEDWKLPIMTWLLHPCHNSYEHLPKTGPSMYGHVGDEFLKPHPP